MYLLNKNSSVKLITLSVLLILLITIPFPTLAATPYTPESDATVVETLPLSWADRDMQALRRQQNLLKKNPTNDKIAAFIAKKYIGLARQHDDPRYYGYAESVLSPWNTFKTAPIPIMVLRATVYQHFHHFNAALNELEKTLQIDTRNAQAWLTKASIELVTGQVKKSLNSCTALVGLADALVTTTCISNALSLQGHANKAYTRLNTLYESTRGISTDIEVWVLTSLAEMAQRLGHLQQSESHYKKALVINNNDSYLISSFADYLLLTKKYYAVTRLLKDKTRNNAHLLRLLLAENKLKMPKFNKHKALLSKRYQADEERNSVSHLRDLARYNLLILNDPKNAFRIAALNWQQQKEPGDAYILLQSAIASDSPSGLHLVKNLTDNKLEDTQFNKLSSELRGMM